MAPAIRLARSLSLDVAASAVRPASGRRSGRGGGGSGVAPPPPAFPLLFPGGGVWLDRAALGQDIVYGDSFVLTRPRVGGPGLVVAQPVPPPSRSAPRAATAAPPAVRRPAPAGPPAAPAARRRRPPGPGLLPGGPSAIEVTDYRIVGGGEEEEMEEGGGGCGVWALPPPPATAATAAAAAAAALPAFPPPSPASPAPTPGPLRIDIHAAAAASTPHPRRTARLAFTCRVCGARTTVAVNPAAWAGGSVFARCGGAAGAAAAEAAVRGEPTPPGGPCGVIHLLNDGLGIFHQLGGPVFPDAGGKALRRRMEEAE